jgi:hypothetical protein
VLSLSFHTHLGSNYAKLGKLKRAYSLVFVSIHVVFHYLLVSKLIMINVNKSNVQTYRPQDSRRMRLSKFLNNWHLKEARLSTLCINHLYPPGKIPGIHFCYRLSQPQGHMLQGLGKLKISQTPVGTEPMTFQLVAQCLNQLHYHVPTHLSISC